VFVHASSPDYNRSVDDDCNARRFSTVRINNACLLFSRSHGVFTWPFDVYDVAREESGFDGKPTGRRCYVMEGGQ
jgi:hypothetical protein